MCFRLEGISNKVYLGVGQKDANHALSYLIKLEHRFAIEGIWKIVTMHLDDMAPMQCFESAIASILAHEKYNFYTMTIYGLCIVAF